MEKNNIEKIIISAILLTGIVFFIFSKITNVSEDNKESIEVTAKKETIIEGDFYAEGDEIADYNYIINPEYLSQTKLSSKACSDINAQIDDVLKSLNVYNSRLRFSDYKRDKEIEKLTIVVENSNVVVFVDYNLKEDTLIVYAKE